MLRGAASHPGDDWRAYPPAFHIAKAERHLRLHREGDKSEPHLQHAATRLLMALELTGREQPSENAEAIRIAAILS